MQGLRGSFQLMKSLNRSVILNKIRSDGPISRAEIAKQTKLTPPTVSNLVKELLNTGIIVESSQGESVGGGRKPTMLELNANNFYIIGLDVGPTHLRTVMSDLAGNPVETFKSAIPSNLTNDELLDLMRQAVSSILEKYKKDKDKFIGIGVGMHGVVDVNNGVGLFAPSLKLSDIPIKEVFEEEFHMIVKVENDARVLALGESWFGQGNGSKNVITVNVGRGIGAGIILDGKLFYGKHFIAGEIGHMTIDIGGPRCDCGNFGCLQTLAAGPAIAERALKELSIGRESMLTDMVENLDDIDGKIVSMAANQGDPLSIDLIQQTGRYLGIGLTNLIHTLNPDKIIIGGGVADAGDLLLSSIKETINKRLITNAAKETDIVRSSLGEYGTAMGASALIFVELFTASSYR
ncbi:ROK family transcriptional regulator [Salirhabdus salicampi]|uniref:ROK family transcriptional regulator n=1 Tax=Salirhabdus salicampi TaxID=476102 RepID=UPI0020C41A78|nr:ROK family transcriptional regulator [Salirhabdus salicampi]MCP8617545.1 ROK family transcriptional regulator [Salirhabdus salicampi]